MFRTRHQALYAVFALFFGLVLAAHGQDDYDYYLKIAGIPGSVTHDGQPGWIGIYELDGVQPQFSHVMTHDAQGNHIGAFTVLKQIDETSIPISLAMLKGTIIEEVVYQAPAELPYDEFICIFKDVTITSIRHCTIESSRGGQKSTESIGEITFTFRRVEWQYSEYFEEKTVFGGWDVTSDTEIRPPAAVKDFKNR